jgi:hypothetical protein|tara:strand:- start:835 stop:1044 length:210 start_codon:yes stop_codon:yes gene_type:complete
MNAIRKHFYNASKAWLAAIIPIVAALVVEVLSDGTRIDPNEWFAVVGLATTQWFGVYWKSNYDLVDETE